MEVLMFLGGEKQTQFKANYKCWIRHRMDSRLRGNDKYGIPERQNIINLR